MKDIFTKIVGWMNKIGADKYKHFAVGAVIASAALIVAVPLGAVLTAAILKERKIDPKADMQDILWTLAGGGMVWLAILAAIIF